MKLKPMADNILLRQHEAAETTVSGIILATATKEKPAIYEVVSAGPGTKDVTVTVKPGDKVVVGKVTDIKKHEDSDKLWICQVDVGQGEDIQIVTAAQNVFAGAYIPVVLDGGTVIDRHNHTVMKIKKGKLRGIESNGMLCAHDELGISDADLGYTPEYGILALPEDTPLGMNIKDYFGINEDVVEFEITSNRPDCFSVIGLARETAVTFGKSFNVFLFQNIRKSVVLLKVISHSFIEKFKSLGNSCNFRRSYKVRFFEINISLALHRVRTDSVTCNLCKK